MADKPVVLLTGAEANELFFRAPEEDLDQAEAYPFMTPVPVPARRPPSKSGHSAQNADCGP